MAIKFFKLTRLNIRKLEKGGKICEHGIIFVRLKNGDGVFKINLSVDGVRIGRSVGKESAGVDREFVEAYIEKVKTESREGRLNLPKGRKNILTFKEASKKYLEKLELEGGNDMKMKKMRLNHNLIPFFKDKPLDKIAPFDQERFKKSRMDAGVKKSTINRDLAVLSHMFNKGIEWGWLQYAPCKIKLFKETEGRIIYLEPEQIERLLESAKNHQCPLIYLFIFIGINTAMRRMEILSLKLENINLEQKTIYIPHAKAGSRLQPITEGLRVYLKDYISTQVVEGQIWLFPSNRAEGGHTVSIEKRYIEVVEKAGLNPKEILRHTLRHTAITHLVQDGVDLPTVKRISGHKTLAMVEKYSHQSGAHINKAMDRLDNRINPKKQKLKAV